MYKIAKVNKNGKVNYYLFKKTELLNFKSIFNDFKISSFEIKDNFISYGIVKNNFYYKIKSINNFIKFCEKNNFILYKYIKVSFSYEKLLLNYYNEYKKIEVLKSFKIKKDIIKKLMSKKTIKRILNLYIPNKIVNQFNIIKLENNFWLFINSYKKINNNFFDFDYINYLNKEDYEYLKINLKETDKKDLDFDVIIPEELLYKTFFEEYKKPIHIKIDDKEEYINFINDNIKDFVKNYIDFDNIKEKKIILLNKKTIKTNYLFIKKVLPLIQNNIKYNGNLLEELNKLFVNNKKEIKKINNFLTLDSVKQIILKTNLKKIDLKDIKEIEVLKMFYKIDNVSLYSLIKNNLGNIYKKLVFKKQ